MRNPANVALTNACAHVVAVATPTRYLTTDLFIHRPATEREPMIDRLASSIDRLVRLVPLRWRYGDLRETPLPLRLLVRTDTYRDIARWMSEHEYSRHFHTRPLRVAIAYPTPGLGASDRASSRGGIEVRCVDIFRDSGRGAWIEPSSNTLLYGIPLFLTTDVPPGRVYLVAPPPDRLDSLR